MLRGAMVSAARSSSVSQRASAISAAAVMGVLSARCRAKQSATTSKPASFAAGFEYRKYEGSYTPDPITVAGEYNGVPSGPTSGSYDVNEVYAEFNIPLTRDSAFGKAFDVSLAGRYSDYSTFGG